MRSWLMMTAQPAIIFQRVFQRAQRLGVEIVGRFVEQQHIAAILQHFGQVDAVALTARQVADLLLLVAAAEIERRAVGAEFTSCLPSLMTSLPPEISSQTVLLASSASRLWST
jgi:uncharacterized protein (UPF0371 family)